MPASETAAFSCPHERGWLSNPTEKPNGPEKRRADQFGPLDLFRPSYCFIRCDERLIRDHNDVWSDTAMQLYTGLYRMVQWTRIPDNQARIGPLFDQYWPDK